MSIIKYIGIGSISLILFSCSKQTEPSTESLFSPNTIIKSIWLDGTLNQEFTYDDQWRIKTNKDYSEIGRSLYYEYAQDTVYVSKTLAGDNEVYKSKFYKISPLIVKELLPNKYRLYYKNENCYFDYVETYEQSTEDGVIGEFEIVSTSIYTYTGQGCNYEYTIPNVEGFKTIFEFDDMNWANQGSINPIFGEFNLGNLTNWTYYLDEDMNTPIGTSYQATFLYNNEGYPIQKVQINLDNEVRKFTYEYYE